MYQMMQKEAFNGIDKLKKNHPTDPSTQKKGYQPLRNEANNKMPPSYQALVGKDNIQNKNTKNVWQIVDDGFGSSRDMSNITINQEGYQHTKEQFKDQQITMKREYV